MSFLAVHKILIDPNTIDPVLVMVSSTRREARQRINEVAKTTEHSAPVRGHWFGLPVWVIRLKVPGGKADLEALYEKFPPKTVDLKMNWGYEYYFQ